MMVYEIEYDVDLPQRSRFPFPAMKVGDSFAISDPDEVQRVRVRAGYWGRRLKRKFRVLLCDPVNRKFRCWRVR